MTDIGKLKDLEAKATPGEWLSDSGDVFIVEYYGSNAPDIPPEPVLCLLAQTNPDDAVFIAALRNAAPSLLARVEAAERAKDGAYHERDMVVAALSKCFPSYLARHSDEDRAWEDDWRWIVYIELPTGQASWHIHDSERELFNHLEVRSNNWDGHNTERKYQRLAALKSALASTGEG